MKGVDWFTVRILFFSFVLVTGLFLVYTGLSKKITKLASLDEKVLVSLAGSKKSEQLFRDEMKASFELSDQQRKASLKTWIEREGHIDSDLEDLSNNVKKELASSNHESAVTRNVAEEASRRLKQKVLTGPDVEAVKQKDALADKKLKQAKEIRNSKHPAVYKIFPWQ
jgi:hypothetical protein